MSLGFNTIEPFHNRVQAGSKPFETYRLGLKIMVVTTVTVIEGRQIKTAKLDFLRYEYFLLFMDCTDLF